MKTLWAPWRSRYIYMRGKKRCIFCGNRVHGKDDGRYILRRSRHSFSMLNLYPYNNGHVMVAPFRHVGDINALTKDELCDLMELVRSTKKTIDNKMGPMGYNIGMNLGKVSGAGFAGHLHIHVVPRWRGDTNFMPVTGDVKVISDSLKELYKLLKAER